LRSFQLWQNVDMWQEIELQGAEMLIWQGFLPAAKATRLQQELTAGLEWRRDRVHVFGREHPIPRLHQWYGDPDARYRWSGITMQPQPWTSALAYLRDQVAVATDSQYNAVLANLYRDGGDTMGWHADNEKELGPQPVIASISLGAERDLLLRPSCPDDRRGRTEKVLLQRGSLLLMRGDTQCNWQHALPRRARVNTPRLNLTFRRIFPA